LTAVERVLVDPRSRFLGSRREAPWFEKMTDSMKGYPKLEEVVKLGCEIREADVPD
jgi:hypothetical protein